MNPFKRNRQTIAKWLLCTLALSLLLAACAAPAAPSADMSAPPTSALAAEASTDATRTITDPTGRTVEIPANPQRVVVLDPGATDAPAADEATTRTITHAMGESVVPANPQRIVVAGYNESEDLVALGVKPVGVMYDAVSRPFLQAALQDVPVIGAEDRPNLEKIVALKPDLIIAVNWAAEGIYSELSAIAPTVVVDRGAGFSAWRESLRLVADVVGRAEEAAKLLADYDQRASALRAALQAQQLDELQVSVFGSWNAQFAVFNYVEGFPISILNEVGLQVTETQRDLYAANPAAFDAMSLEFLPQLDADLIFFLDSTIEGQRGDKTFVSSVKNNPLFTQLSAVQAGNVCEVPYGRWNEGSVLAANLILDDIERCLLRQ